MSLILLASRWQISLDVDAESTGRLTARPSISATETIIGFLVFIACDSGGGGEKKSTGNWTKKGHHVVLLIIAEHEVSHTHEYTFII